MKTYNLGLHLAQKNIWRRIYYETYFFLAVNNEGQSDDVRNVLVEGPSYLGDNTFTELFTQNIQDTN